MDILNYIFKVITAPELQRALLPIKIIVFIFSFIAIGLIIYWFFTTHYKDYLFLERWRELQHWKKIRQGKIERFKQRKKEEKNMLKKEASEKSQNESKAKGDEFVKKEFIETEKMGEWERVLEKLKSKNELNYKLAFIDADKIFNETLKEKNEELSSELVSNKEAVIKAKQVLEKMLTHPEAKLSLKRAKELVGVYKKALSEMKAI